MNYKKLNELLVGRNAKSKKLSNNTYAERREDGSIAIRLHQTDIITFSPKGKITLNSGGWKTVTTKARLNEFAPVSISQSKGIWHVSKPAQWDDVKKEMIYFPSVMFKDGMTIYNGRFGNYLKSDKKQNQLRKEIQNYSKLVVSKLPVAPPSGGDCWLCLGLVGNDTEHLRSHMKEGYVVPSLVKNALEAANCGQLYYSIAFQANNFGSGLHDRIGTFVKRYLYKQFGLVR